MKHGKKWRIRWFDENGKRQSQVYDDYKDAEFALKAHQTEVEEIRRGFKVRPPKDRTFEELAKKWMVTRAAVKRAPKHDESLLRVHLSPTFGELTLKQITAEKIAVFSAELSARRAPQTVKHCLNLLGAMLRQAQEWGWTETLPRIRKPKVHLFGKDYRWLRTREEIDGFLAAAKELDANRRYYKEVGRYETVPIFPLYATAIYTGMRAGELAGLKWSDVSFERRLITVQRSFNGPTKAGDVRHVPIIDVLLPILKAWKLECGSKSLVFPNVAGEMMDPKSRHFSEFLRKTLIQAGLDARHVHFHGLRHTFASHWVLNGGDLFRLQKILGHGSAQMTQRYAHLSPAAYESDWSRFGKAEEDKKGEVIELAHVKD
jgi:integrase